MAHCHSYNNQDYLGIQSSSVPAERVFSSAADLLVPKRCAMTAANASMMMILKWTNRSKLKIYSNGVYLTKEEQVVDKPKKVIQSQSNLTSQVSQVVPDFQEKSDYLDRIFDLKVPRSDSDSEEDDHDDQ